jgi:acetyl-CoA/propionyl-CoA carboxylase
MFDFTVTIKDRSKLYVNSPFVVGEAFDASATGISAAECESEASAISYVKALLSAIPQNNAEGVVAADITDDINRAVAFDAKNYKAAELVAQLADNGRFVRVYEKYAKNLCTGFASFGGVMAAVIASDNEGTLDISAARAAAKMISFCDSFGIPVVTLVDSCGLDASADAEAAAYASELSRLALAFASSECAKVSVVLGKAYGAAFTLLASKTLGADLAYALEDACISVLSPEASVAFVWNDKVTEDKKREEVEAEWREKCASAQDAADCGAIDDVIESADLRKRICAALSMLAYKADGVPTRKHTVMPL